MTNGKVVYGALGFGGFLGWDEKLFAVPWKYLQIHAADGRDSETHIVLNVTKEELANMPGFDKNNWPNFADPEFGLSVAAYYKDHQPASESKATQAMKNTPGKQGSDRALAGKADRLDTGVTAGSPTGTRTWRASRLEHMNLRNSAGQKIGAIEDLVITTEGHVAYAALGFGGFLGWDQKLFAVPWNELVIHVADAVDSDNHIVLNVSKEELKNAPGFDKSNWPNFADPNFTETIDTYYQDHRASAQGAYARSDMNRLAQDLTTVSKDGYSAFRAIHLARLAIFDGDTKTAHEMLDKAKTDLVAATKDVRSFTADDTAFKDGKSNKYAANMMDQIPIDGEIAIADTYVPSAEKATHIAKANEHIKSGHSKEAIEELRLGEVDIVYARMMLPLEATTKRVADAVRFVSEHKYYEANLALKAAEDGVSIESVDLTATPTKSSTAPIAKKGT